MKKWSEKTFQSIDELLKLLFECQREKNDAMENIEKNCSIYSIENKREQEIIKRLNLYL